MNRGQKIIGKRRRGGHQIEYLVKWQGWTIQFSTWQYKKNIKELNDLIQVYQKQEGKEQSFFKSSKISKPLSDDSQCSLEQEYQIPFNIKDERRSKLNVRYTGETFQIIERKEEQRDVKFLVKKKYSEHWVDQYYLMRKYPQKLCKFYEKVYLDPKRKLKWLKKVSDDIKFD